MAFTKPPKVLMPSYGTANVDAEAKSMEICNLCIETLKGKCRRIHERLLNAQSIRSIR